MIHSDRVRDLLEQRNLSQSELARRVNVTQGAIAKIVSRNPGGSAHLHKIAQVLRTTPAYLTGEIDDPDEGAQPPPVVAAAQILTLPVVLPNEAALVAGFEALLLASPRMNAAELARELAKRLPTLLRVAGGAAVDPASVLAAAHPAVEEAPDDVRPGRRRASRK